MGGEGAFLNPLTLPLRQSICQGGHLSGATTPPPWRETPPRGSKRGDFLANLARRHFGLKLLTQQGMQEWLHNRGYTTILRYLVANNVLKLDDNPERVGYTERHQQGLSTTDHPYLTASSR